MRKLLYIFILLSFMGCDDFLDVNPKSIVVNDDLFQTDEGFQDALYGVYTSLNQNALYGKQLSFEFTELCAQNFMPHDIGLTRQALARHEYVASSATSYIKGIWEDMYEVIGYVNNILVNLEGKTKEDIRYYDLYKGEALALRAAMHFDLLRLYAVDINSTDTKRLNRGIPYIYSYEYSITKFSSVEKVYENIIKDLKEAEELLGIDRDLLVNPRKHGGNTFTDARITHLNLYAVQAMLARVYWQKKDMENAAIYAKKVIDSEKFPLMDKTSLDTDLSAVMSLEETIWGLCDRTFFEDASDQFLVKSSRLILRDDYKEPYDIDEVYGKDYRMDWFGEDSNSKPFFAKLYNPVAVERLTAYDEYNGYLGINMIRIPEMYYIMAEALVSTDNTKAMEYFDAVIESRGIVGLAERGENIVLTKEMIMQERRKEFIGEGQEWFRMKRENEDITIAVSGEVVPGSDIVYRWPYPDIEDEMNQ